MRLLCTPPRQIGELPVVGVADIERAQLQRGAAFAEIAIDPAGHFGGLEWVANGREVYEVQSFAFAHAPGVGVTEEERLHLAAREQDGEQFLRVGEAGFFRRVAADWVMVDHDECGLVGMGIKGAGEPGALFFAEAAGRLFRYVERVEQEPVGARAFHDGDVFAHERRRRGASVLQRAPEDVAFVVIAEGEVKRRAGGAQRRQEAGEGDVIVGEAVIEGAVAVDKHASRLRAELADLGDHGAETFGHVAFAGDGGRVADDVGIGKERPAMWIRANGAGAKHGQGEHRGAGESGAAEEVTAGQGGEVERHEGEAWDGGMD